MVKNIVILRNDNARDRREILPDDVKSLSVLKVKFENSQFLRYMPKVLKMLHRAGIKGTVKIETLRINPILNNIHLPLPTIARNRGVKKKGYSFTNAAVPKKKPEIKMKTCSFRKVIFFPVCKADCKIRMLKRRKKIPAPSICPEEAISITGSGCHAYRTDLHTGNSILASIFMITIQVARSMIHNIVLNPITDFDMKTPVRNMSCAAGGYMVISSGWFIFFNKSADMSSNG